GAPVLSVFGGKITTYRVLARQAMKTLKAALKTETDDWTRDVPLPGGDFSPEDFEQLCAEYLERWPFLTEAVIIRLVRAYGTDTKKILVGAQNESDLGTCFGAGLYEAEVDWLIRHEFALEAEDILWRRSKLGLHMTEAEKNNVARWFKERNPVSAAPETVS
ncbi:MAG: glycerol-3-phosphate dehydrogenase C-terminal domain-containing protein, partial [Pseudomonadota bacterium]